MFAAIISEIKVYWQIYFYCICQQVWGRRAYNGTYIYFYLKTNAVSSMHLVTFCFQYLNQVCKRVMIRFVEEVCRILAYSFACLSKSISYFLMPSFLLISRVCLQCTTMSLFFFWWKGKEIIEAFTMKKIESYVFLRTHRSYFHLLFNTLFWHPPPKSSAHDPGLWSCDCNCHVYGGGCRFSRVLFPMVMSISKFI